MTVTPIRKRRIRVLSLFDGVATALLILEHKLSLDIELYLSSEIDPKALRIQRENWEGKIVQIGDVRNLDETLLSSFGRIDLVIGGGPCDELTLLNWRGRGLDEPESSGHLFYNFKMVKDFFEKRMAQHSIPFFWLFECTCHMRKSVIDKITSELGGIQPVKCCASQFLPVKRQRYFWGNIPLMQEKDMSTSSRTEVRLQNFLGPDRRANVPTVNTITSNVTNQFSCKYNALPVTMFGRQCYLTIKEVESLMGLPAHYSDVNDFTPRERLRVLAKGWCVPVVESLLKVLIEFYVTKL